MVKGANREALNAERQKAEFKVVYMEPTRLGFHPDNPKEHGEEQMEALGNSLEEFGWLMAPVYNTRTQRLVDGHARVAKAIQRNEARIPVRCIDVSEEVELRILASLDRIGEKRGYSDTALASLLRKCSDHADISGLGWSEDDLNDLLLKCAPSADDLPKEPAETANRAEKAQAPAEPRSRPSEEGDGAIPAAAVRMVQLFFDADQHKNWLALIEQACQSAEVETPSEAVLIALDHFNQSTLEMESNP